MCQKKIKWAITKLDFFVPNSSPTTINYCGNEGKRENQVNYLSGKSNGELSYLHKLF